MIILDTDHITILKQGRGAKYETLSAKMAASPDQHFVTTVVTLEEQMRGWLGLLKRRKSIHQQLFPYDELIGIVDFYSRIEILPLARSAAVRFDALRQQRIRIGTMDLKIASIALAEDALLLSANLGDFQQVPSLHVENWLH